MKFFCSMGGFCFICALVCFGATENKMIAFQASSIMFGLSCVAWVSALSIQIKKNDALKLQLKDKQELENNSE